MLIYEWNVHWKNLSQIGAEKIAFFPKSDGHKDIRMDISNYRVALQLKMPKIVLNGHIDYLILIIELLRFLKGT